MSAESLNCQPVRKVFVVMGANWQTDVEVDTSGPESNEQSQILDAAITALKSFKGLTNEPRLTVFPDT